MYVNLPHLWDAGNRSSVCRPQALCAYEESAAVAAKDTGMQAAFSAADTEVKSDCSTADTADRLPGSPELEQAHPRNMQRSQHLVVARKSGQNKLGKELQNMGNRTADPKNSDAQHGFLPSVGSAGHRVGRCKPCAFAGTKGCSSGSDCRFCHLCEVGEKKRRQKEKRARFAAVRHARYTQNAKENVTVAAQAVAVVED
jgi:hypothetical protein